MYSVNHSSPEKGTTLSGTASVAGVLSHQTCDGVDELVFTLQSGVLLHADGTLWLFFRCI